MTTNRPHLSDAALARRIIELAYRLWECAIEPDHPVSRANRARWERELRIAKSEQARREASEYYGRSSREACC